MYLWQPSLTGFIDDQVTILFLPSVAKHSLHELGLLRADKLACVAVLLRRLFVKVEAGVLHHAH